MPFSPHPKSDMNIGELEADILSVVNRLGQATARDILESIGSRKDIAYTTVSTTLDRLHKKGLLRRRGQTGRGGTRFIYSLADKKKMRERVVGSMIRKLVRAFGPEIVPAIYERSREYSEKELRELERRVAWRRKS